MAFQGWALDRCNPFPPSGDWRIYGVHLPDDVLRKIYHGNADRIFGWTDTRAQVGN